MTLATELIDQLKKDLRSQGLTYSTVADHLELSESSVKRLFRDRDMSLARLESICSLLHTDIADLCTRAEKSRRQLASLDLEQEQLLVSDEQLFLIAVHLLFDWPYGRILDVFDIDEHKAQRHLAQLDRMGIIELLPENRIRQRLAPNFEWIPNGPIQQFFEQSVQGNFFQSSFTGRGELRLVLNGWMSLDSIEAFHDAMRRLAQEFEQQKDFDRQAPATRRQGTSLVIAIRPWALEIFERYRR